MANFKRKNSKRIIRCSICTKYRHLGNSVGRRDPREASRLKEAKNEIRDAG